MIDPIKEIDLVPNAGATRRALARAIPTWPAPARPFGWSLVAQLRNIETGRCDMGKMPALMAWQVEQINKHLTA